jgi:hypothetical protein
MKFNKFILSLITVALFLFALSVPLLAQVTPTTATNIVAGPFLLTTTSTNLTSAQYRVIPVRQGKHLLIAPQYIGGDATNVGTLALQFKLGYNGGTLTTTTKPITKTFTAGGAATVRDYAVITADTIGPADTIYLSTITNAAVNIGATAAGSITISNVILQWTSP